MKRLAPATVAIPTARTDRSRGDGRANRSVDYLLLLKERLSMSTRTKFRRRAVLTVSGSALLWAASLFGATVTKLPDEALAPLRASIVTKRIRIDRLPIYDNERSVIDLEEFQVWSPDAKVILHGDDGVILEKLDPPPMRFFRGLVNGDPESFAFFSMDPSGGNIQALIVTRDKKFSVASARRRGVRPGGRPDESVDVFLTTFNDEDSVAETTGMWQCEVDKMKIRPVSSPLQATGINGLPVVAQGISGSQSYAIKVDIETDFELYQNAGSSSTTLTNYITNLTGAVSTIYNRDLKTNVTQGNVNIYTTSADPWNATNPDSGISELGDYYHTNHGGPTASSVVFLSGKGIGGGIAWESIVCGNERLCSSANCGDPTFNGHYAGPYAWCGGIGNLGTVGLGTIPDPNATTGGTLYGMTSGTQTYWPLTEYAHELGHNMAGQHTHCIAITDAERIAAGFTDGSLANSTSNFVDHCFGSEGSGCFSGSDFVAGSQSVFKGTLMSYCHNISVSNVPQSRFTFGQLTEPSHHQLDDYMLNPAGPLNFGKNVVTAVGTFTISAITAPASVPANSTGNTASISPISGATYAWTITNGTITSSTTSNSITFAAGASGTVTVRATAYGANRCGITDTKSITVSAGCTGPAITTQPLSVTIVSGSSTTLTVVATGTTPTYQWYIGPSGTTTTPIAGGTSASLTVNPIANTTYWVRVTACTTNVNSNAATVTVLPPGSVPRGDANGDGNVTVADVFYLINFLFSGGPNPVSGDANGDGSVTVADVFYLINYLFSGGPAPPP